MKNILFCLIGFLSLSTMAQKQFVNCDSQKPISNLMIFDADSNYIGITNEKGILEKELSSKQISINHPMYGNQKIDVTEENRICIDFFNEELQELFIEKGISVRQELLNALQISYKAFSDENSGKTIYKIADHAFSDNILNESLVGYLRITGNGKNIRYLNPKYEFTEYIHKKEYNYYIIPHYGPFALDKQIFPLHNRKDYKQFVTLINESEISKSENHYYIDLPDIDDFITIELASESKKIAKISFPKVRKDSRQKLGSFTQYVNTEMFFDDNNGYKMNRLELKTYYQIEDKKVHYEFKAVEVDLLKEEVSEMKTYRLLGIAMVNSMINLYMDQRRDYNYEKLGIDRHYSPWYYR